MPKSFAQLNYYEMLDIEPDATTFDIRHAYNAALQVYQPDSLASYSFFSGDERQTILSLIEKAY
jgi:DnaJ-class molecular chaperone